jgi:hypothetical protein
MRTQAQTKPIGLLGTVAPVAAVLAFAHSPIAAADAIEASGAAITAAPSTARAHAGARGLPRVLCWTKKSRASGRLIAQRRPKRCGLVSRRHPSRPAVRLLKLRWKRWGAKRGHATGVAAESTSRTRFQVTLRRPVRGCRGRVFSRAVLRNRSATRRFALRTRCAIGGGRQGKPGGEQPGGAACVGADEAVLAGDDGPPSLSPALYDVTFTLDASLDGLDADGNLPIDIDAVCGVPADVAADGAKLVQLTGLALLSDSTEIWTCAGSAGEAGSGGAAECSDIPETGGALLQGDEATSALDNADTAFVGVQLVPRAGWRRDEDGEPVPTFDAHWVKITD